MNAMVERCSVGYPWLQFMNKTKMQQVLLIETFIHIPKNHGDLAFHSNIIRFDDSGNGNFFRSITVLRPWKTVFRRYNWSVFRLHN